MINIPETKNVKYFVEKKMLQKFNNKVFSSVFLAKRIISYFKKNCKSNVGGGDSILAARRIQL